MWKQPQVTRMPRDSWNLNLITPYPQIQGSNSIWTHTVTASLTLKSNHRIVILSRIDGITTVKYSIPYTSKSKAKGSQTLSTKDLMLVIKETYKKTKNVNC